MNHFDMPEQECPHCGHKMDKAMKKDGNPPAPGDVGICIRCAGIYKFSELGTFEKLTQQQILEIPEEDFQEMENLQRLIRTIHRDLEKRKNVN